MIKENNMLIESPKHSISKEAYIRILETVFKSLRQVGFKATTMDMIASQLSMSKRTLYEIFESKEHMLHEALSYYHRIMSKRISRIFSESPNVMEALIRIIRLQLNVLVNTTPLFFSDMDTIGKKIHDQHVSYKERNIEDDIMSIIKIGIQQDVFRAEENYRISLKFLNIQFEALKRTENHFPKDVSLSDVYTVLSINFLRSIATLKGTQILEECIEKYKEDLKRHNNPF